MGELPSSLPVRKPALHERATMSELASALRRTASSLAAVVEMLDRDGHVDLQLVRRLNLDAIRTATAALATTPIAEVLEAVAESYNVSVDDLFRVDRNVLLVDARSLASYILHRMMEISSTAVGEALGGRNHTTVLHHCARVERLMPNTSEGRFREHLVDVMRRLGIEWE